VRILVVTAEARATQLDQIRTLGADAVLVKPTSPDSILREVEDLLTHAGNGKIPAQNHAAAPLALTGHRGTLAKAHARFRTPTPPLAPPALTCPECDRPLQYDFSQVGGVSNRHPEQWDYYICPTCGAFQYRQRTRSVRRMQ
jgi:hypothetical protein